MLFVLLFVLLPESRSRTSRYAHVYYWVKARADDYVEDERRKRDSDHPQQAQRAKESLAELRRRVKLPYTSPHLTEAQLRKGLAKLPPQ